VRRVSLAPINADSPDLDRVHNRAIANTLEGTRRRPIVLVLDNCEHVVDPLADLVQDWIAATREHRCVM